MKKRKASIETIEELDDSDCLPLPEVPFYSQPPAIPLALLLDNAIQKTFHELTVLSELLPKKSDLERKISILHFAHSSKQLFGRLLAVVRWLSKDSSKSSRCIGISYLLDQQAAMFVDTADKLTELARATLVGARLPCFQMPSAVDVLTLGSYRRLPACIKSSFVPEFPISANEQSSVLARLNQVICFKISSSATLPLPSAMRRVTIKHGTAIFSVPGEFRAVLTVLDDAPSTAWTLLSVKILVAGSVEACSSSSDRLVHPLQTDYLLRMAQVRISNAERPLDELYEVLHAFCVSLQLDVWFCQTASLMHERAGANTAIDEYVIGRRLVISYWRPAPAAPAKPPASSRLGGMVAAQGATGKMLAPMVPKSPAALPQPRAPCRLTFEVAEEDRDASLPLRLRHCPEQETVDGQMAPDRLPSLKAGCEQPTVERLLSDTISARIRHKLLRLMHKLKSIQMLDCRLVTERRGIASGGTGSPQAEFVPFLEVSLLEPCVADEKLWFSVNWFTGKFLCGIEILGSLAVFGSMQTKLDSGQTDLLKQLLPGLRLCLLLNRYRKTAAYFPVVNILDRTSPLNVSSMAAVKEHLPDLSNDAIILQFKRLPGFFLVADFPMPKSEQQCVSSEISPTFHLVSTSKITFAKNLVPLVTAIDAAPDDADSVGVAVPPGHGGAGDEKQQRVLQLDATAFLTDLSLSTDPGSKEKKVQASPLFVRQLASAISVCFERLALLVFSAALHAKGIRFNAHYSPTYDGVVQGPYLQIIQFDALPNCPGEIFVPLWRTLYSLVVRVQSDRAATVFACEFQFVDPPVAAPRFPAAVSSSDDRAAPAVAPPPPKSKTVLLTYPVAASRCPAYVDELQDELRAYAYLYKAVLAFAKDYHDWMHEFIAVRTFTYKRLVLGYGPACAFLAQFSCARPDKPYSLALGCVARAPAGGNPHASMLPQLQALYAETQSVARIVWILQNTVLPMMPLSQLSRSFYQVSQRPENIGDGKTSLYSSPSNGFAIFPLSQTRVRLVYKNHFALELNFIANGKLCVADLGAADFVVGDGSRRFVPVKALRAFFDHVTSGCHGNAAKKTESVDVTDSDDPSRFSALPQASAGDVAEEFKRACIAFGTKIATVKVSSGGMKSFGQGSATGGMEEESSEEEPMELSELLRAKLGPESVVGAVANAGSIFKEDLPPFPENLSPIEHWAPSALQFLVDQVTFVAAALKPKLDRATKTDEANKLKRLLRLRIASGLERFCGCVYILEQLECLAKAGTIELTELKVLPGFLKFELGSLRCRLMLDPACMTRIRFDIARSAKAGSPLPDDERDAFERFFMTFLATSNYNEQAVVSFVTLLRFIGSCARENVGSAFATLLKAHLNPEITEPEHKWRAQLCIVVPPLHVSVANHTLAIGGPGFVQQQKEKPLLLLWIKLVRKSNATAFQICLPLFYDASANAVLLPDSSIGSLRWHAKILKTRAALEPVLKRQNDIAAETGECSVFLVVRDMLKSFEIVNRFRRERATADWCDDVAAGSSSADEPGAKGEDNTDELAHQAPRSKNLAGDFTQSIRNALATLTAETELQDFAAQVDAEEIKNSIEQAAHDFYVTARKLDSYFCRQAQVIAAHFPEQVFLEEIVETKAQIERCTSLIQKHKEKVGKWQSILQQPMPSALAPMTADNNVVASSGANTDS